MTYGKNCGNCEHLERTKTFNGGELYRCKKTGKYISTGEIFQTNCLLGMLFKRKKYTGK